MALLLVSGLGVVIGQALTMIIPMLIIRVVSAILFLAFGAYTILSSRKEETEQVEKFGAKSVALSVFSIVASMELGDKTQLAVIALTAECNMPLLVYAGAATAFIIITGLGALIGSRLLRLIPLRLVKLGSGVLFILFGIVFLLNTALGLLSV